MKNRFFREFLFKWYWLAPIFIFLGLIIGLSKGLLDQSDQPMCLTLMTASLAWTYFFQKQKLEEDKLFLQVFENYNKRFYELSDDLNNLSDDSNNSSEIISPVVHRYFDLCIEQYQLYERGRIPEKTWLYWIAGMNHLLKKPPVQRYWQEMQDLGLSNELTISYIKKHVSKPRKEDQTALTTSE